MRVGVGLNNRASRVYGGRPHYGLGCGLDNMAGLGRRVVPNTGRV